MATVFGKDPFLPLRTAAYFLLSLCWHNFVAFTPLSVEHQTRPFSNPGQLRD